MHFGNTGVIFHILNQIRSFLFSSCTYSHYSFHTIPLSISHWTLLVHLARNRSTDHSSRFQLVDFPTLYRKCDENYVYYSNTPRLRHSFRRKVFCLVVANYKIQTFHFEWMRFRANHNIKVICLVNVCLIYITKCWVLKCVFLSFASRIKWKMDYMIRWVRMYVTEASIMYWLWMYSYVAIDREGVNGVHCIHMMMHKQSTHPQHRIKRDWTNCVDHSTQHEYTHSASKYNYKKRN